MTDDPIARAKSALRQSAEAMRAVAHAEIGTAAAEALARHGMVVLGERSFRSVSGYWPMRSEMDLRPLLTALANTGRDVALPAVIGLGQPLQFRRWRPGEGLATGRFGTEHPPPEAAIIEPDVLLVPLLAYDDRHYRLGYGAGFYDRTLAGLRARKQVLVIGVAYSAQRVADVPVDGWDEALDLVLTERGIV
jgi:5-formyltetrahydrofolate cyclo-ligase